ncbi:MAG: enoyl-CoA hydratase [Candidatus Marinimicrobia bacterium]|nr:enoyl-CoA hydratase [Candidatus Neomarinimicrobiota bacterium]
MGQTSDYTLISAEMSGNVGIITLCRPPHNFFNNLMIHQIANAYEVFDSNPNCRAIVLAAEGKAFCAGADLVDAPLTGTLESEGTAKHLYKEALRIFRTKTPVIAAIHGSAIGGGMGLSLSADFRVTCKEAKFSVNFSRLGLHPGFGLSVTLPRLIGPQKASLLFYTGRRIPGDEAVAIGVADLLTPKEDVLTAAIKLAEEVAGSAPLAVISIRETLRRGLADAVEAATERESTEQDWLSQTEDFKEGVKAMNERRKPSFKCR